MEKREREEINKNVFRARTYFLNLVLLRNASYRDVDKDTFLTLYVFSLTGTVYTRDDFVDRKSIFSKTV